MDSVARGLGAKALSGLPLRAQLRARGLVPIANKNLAPDNTTVGATGGITTRTRHTAIYDTTGIVLVYGNAFVSNTLGVGDSPNANSLTVHGCVELPDDTSKFCRVTANGQSDIPLGMGGLVFSDMVGVDATAGQFIYCRTYNNADGSTNYSYGYAATTTSWGEGRTSGSDTSNSGSVSAGITGGMAPCLILGYTDHANPKCLLGVGDSIMRGQGDTAERNRGFLQIAVGSTMPMINLAHSGDHAVNFQGRGRQYRMALAAYGTGAVVEYGTNDLYVDGRTALQLRADLLNIGNALRRLLGPDAPLYLTTLVPRTTSTDGWQTGANQTVASSSAETERQTHNAWVRARSFAPFNGYFDTAQALEADSSGALAAGGAFWPPGSTQVSGTATSGSSTTLADTTKTWTTDQWAGYVAYIVSGTGAGQSRGIWTNTSTALTIEPSSAWSTNPDATSVYRILDARTVDGTHPSSIGATAMAAKVAISVFA